MAKHNHDVHHRYEAPYRFDPDCLGYSTKLVCPYCSTDNGHDWTESYTEREEWSEMECSKCERTFEFSPHIIMRNNEYYGDDGFDVQIKPCKGGHQWAVTTRWVKTQSYEKEHGVWDWVPLPEDQWEGVTESHCIVCGKQEFSRDDCAFQLPWRTEWSNPDFFDPGGILRAIPPSDEMICLSCHHRSPTQDIISYDDPDDGHLFECPECYNDDPTKFKRATLLDFPPEKSPILDSYGRWKKQQREEQMGWRTPKPVDVQKEVEAICKQAKIDFAKATFPGVNTPEEAKAFRSLGEALRANKELLDSITHPLFREKNVYQEIGDWFNRIYNVVLTFGVMILLLAFFLLISGCHSYDPNKPSKIYKKKALPSSERVITVEQPRSIHGRGKSTSVSRNVTTQNELPCETTFVVQEGHIVDWYCDGE
jgi:hypothetical protein